MVTQRDEFRPSLRRRVGLEYFWPPEGLVAADWTTNGSTRDQGQQKATGASFVAPTSARALHGGFVGPGLAVDRLVACEGLLDVLHVALLPATRGNVAVVAVVAVQPGG